jgi:hypothetical protein
VSNSRDVYKRAEGDFKNLFCGIKDYLVDDDYSWNNCTWERRSDNSSCHFTQNKNETTKYFEINQSCKRDFDNVQFIGTRNQDPLHGDHLCGINVRNLRPTDSGLWGCKLDYTKFNCTAEGSAWLVVYI